MTHAIVANEPGGPEVLEYASVEPPVPGPGQLLIKVAAAGVNFIETYQRSGTYKVDYPFTPGAEAAGTIEAIGEGVEDFAVGDRIATAEGSRTYADYAIVEAEKALPVPAGVDDHTAAALPLQGITAHYLMNSSFRVEPGHTVLLHAGAGGVGLLLTQLLKARGHGSSPPFLPMKRPTSPSSPAPTKSCAMKASRTGSASLPTAGA